MKTLKETEISLTGFGYKLCFEQDSSQPYSVECIKDGELFNVDYFTSKGKAERHFESESIGLSCLS